MKKIIFTIIAAVSVLSACDKRLDKINTDPNNMVVGSVHPASLLPDVLYSGACAMVNQSYTMANELIQYTVSTNSMEAFSRYIIPNGNSASLWNHCARWSSCANHMRELASKEPHYCNFEAIALTMRAYYMQILTDAYGDVPFSDAYGVLEGNTKPKFDTQKEVYLQLISDLKRANTLYDSTTYPMSDSQASKDLLYKGNLMRWQKFTNSLLLRVLIRVSNCKEIDVAKEMTEIYNSPGIYPIFASEEDAAVMRFSGVDNNLNPYGSTNILSFEAARRAAEFTVDEMNDTGDPRISLYFVQVGGVWRGAKSGVVNREESGSGSAAKLNKAMLGSYNSPFSFMNYDEVLFILAEAALKGLIPGGEILAADFYAKAVEASVRHWSSLPNNEEPISDRAVSQFLAKVGWNGTYEQLMTQKYIALYWCGYESWSEYRRTGYPRLQIAKTTMNDQILPRRFEYPINTASTNPDNYAAVIKRMRDEYNGGDDMKTPVWWSKYRIENFK